MKELNLELIERHIEGKLRGEEKVQFEKELATDKELAKEVKLFESLINGIDASGALAFEEKVKLWEQKLKGTNGTSSDIGKQPNKTLYWILGIVLLGLIGAGIWYIAQPKQPQEELIFASNFERYPSTTVRGNNENVLTEGLSNYDNGNYNKAILILDEYIKNTSEGNEDKNLLPAKFYLGVSQLANDEPELAIDNFKAIIDAGYLSLEEAAQWYLALSYLRSEQIDDLNTQLLSIINTPQHTYKTKAEKLLKEVQDLTK